MLQWELKCVMTWQTCWGSGRAAVPSTRPKLLVISTAVVGPIAISCTHSCKYVQSLIRLTIYVVSRWNDSRGTAHLFQKFHDNIGNHFPVILPWQQTLNCNDKHCNKQGDENKHHVSYCHGDKISHKISPWQQKTNMSQYITMAG